MKTIHVAVLVVVVSHLSCPAIASSATWVVDTFGGGDFTSIQDCIDAASAGDTCQVKAGVYYENIDYIGKDLTVVGMSAAIPAIIDGSLAGPAVTFENGETENAVLDTMTVRNGMGLGNGGGVYCVNSSPTIRNCTISTNGAERRGGGIYCAGGSLTITGCTISDNVANHALGSYGAGIYFSGGSLTVSNCAVTGNAAMGSMSHGGEGGGIAFYGNTMLIEQCVVRENGLMGDGGGIYCEGTSARIRNCNIVGNMASAPLGGSGAGGGIAARGGSIVVTNSTITENEAHGGGGVYCDTCSLDVANSILWGNTAHILFPEIEQWGGSVTVTYTDVGGGWVGAGNIDADPLFVDPANNDFHLQGGSPCMDAGNNSSPDLPARDIDGEARKMDGDGDGSAVADMGSDELPAPPWAAASTLPAGEDAGISNTVNRLGMLLAPLAALPLWMRLRRGRSCLTQTARESRSHGSRFMTMRICNTTERELQSTKFYVSMKNTQDMGVCPGTGESVGARMPGERRSLGRLEGD